MIEPDWPAATSVKSLTTTRQGGVSQGPYASLNLADHVGDAADDVQRNRLTIQRRLSLPKPPVWLRQLHSDRVVDAAHCEQCPCADASFAAQAQVVCAVLTADCLPVLFCDRAGTRVAAAHAGWRGLAAGVLESTVRALDIEPQRLLAWLGPAIGPAVFEVGGEVRRSFVDRQAEAARAFLPRANGRWLADLYELARIRLLAVGVSAVYGGGLCTFSDRERFYSYRRDGVTGRMASLIWLA
jgi:YfiH family protein